MAYTYGPPKLPAAVFPAWRAPQNSIRRDSDGWHRGDKGIVFHGDHGGSLIMHEGPCCGVEVSEHSITTPSSDAVDGVGVHIDKEQGHAPPCL